MAADKDTSPADSVRQSSFVPRESRTSVDWLGQLAQSPKAGHLQEPHRGISGALLARVQHSAAHWGLCPAHCNPALQHQ